jgi:hypothetical protein
VDHTCIYASEKHESRVLRKLQRGLTAVNSWYEHCNTEINEDKSQAIYFSRRRKVPGNVLQIKGRDIPFVNSVKYLCVTIDRKMIWRHNIERTVAKVLRKYIKKYSLFKSGHLSANIKLKFYRALIKSVMTYTCPIWEYLADALLLKFQRLQKRVLSAIGNLDRCTPVRELHVTFKISYVYDYITKLCRTYA